MKKILSTLLLFAICFSLCSCSLIKKVIPGFGKEDGGNVGNNNNQPEVRTTITAEEFETSKNIKNYTNVVSTTVKALNLETGEYWIDPETGDDFSTEVNTELKSEVACYTTSGGKLSDTEYWYVLKDGVWYWVRENTDSTTGYVGSRADDYTVNGLLENSPFEYDDLVYDEEKGAYKVIQVEEAYSVEYFFYFENGNPVKMGMSVEFTITIEDQKYKRETFVESNITNIGTTVVDVPEFTIQ